jgi:hydrogenase nickel incorporation protein HypB
MCVQDSRRTVPIHEPILAANASRARHNREHFRREGTLAINLMGSPGSGKTAVLEATAARLGRGAMAALTADLATDHDAVRMRRAGIPSAAITTGTACHLDADLVHRALHEEGFERVPFLFMENVGNLVCPALFDLGQGASVVALAVTEGEDKPLKYPVIFVQADLVLLTKTDLLPYSGCTVDGFRESLARVDPGVRLLPVCARTGDGLDAWMQWLAETAQTGSRHSAARARE